MIQLTLQEAVAALGATWVIGSADRERSTLSGVSTDTRSIQRGNAYVALAGPNFDGASFATQAAERGAALVVLNDRAGHRERLESLSATHGVAGAVVPDTLAALGALASEVRTRIEAPVIAITGSCGKTSTKSMLHAMLSRCRATVASPASFNNDVGVPHSIFLADESTRALVLEVGTNAPGEIGRLARIARPDVAVVTNVGRSHLAGLGSRSGVAKEKAALVAALEPNGAIGGSHHAARAVLNLDDRMLPKLLRRVAPGAAVVTFSAEGDPRATFSARNVRVTAEGTTFELVGAPGVVLGDAIQRVDLPLLGRHAVANFLAAASAAFAVGAHLDHALAAARTLRPSPHRLESRELRGVRIVDDTYNANPESVRAALDVLSSIDPGRGRRVLVLGAMGELGERSAALHADLGAEVAESSRQASIARVVLVGSDDVRTDLDACAASLAASDGPPVVRCEGHDEAADLLAADLSDGDVVLAKASRAQRLERVLDGLAERWSDEVTSPGTRAAKGAEVVA